MSTKSASRGHVLPTDRVLHADVGRDGGELTAVGQSHGSQRHRGGPRSGPTAGVRNDLGDHLDPDPGVHAVGHRPVGSVEAADDPALPDDRPRAGPTEPRREDPTNAKGAHPRASSLHAGRLRSWCVLRTLAAGACSAPPQTAAGTPLKKARSPTEFVLSSTRSARFSPTHVAATGAAASA